ncbi:D-aminoacylase [Paenibacillus stellifer]|uniref:D-aminoacylase n=1 Tax=Paenibacillus stellifer TaxID=169760 RepID=A0A089N441_9BACL|nr:D-aminoacylase [Paenibacillus stellifer]AIQ63484.1 D-aminoacylase [Paenibacillus stellifer]
MNSYDIVIKNAKIVDGTGSPWYYADIAVAGDTIARIGKINDTGSASVFDAKGLVASPGFIDMHSHSDLFVMESGLVSAKLRQGITTELLGQDGISAAPLPQAFIERWQGNLSGLDGMPDIEWDWHDVDSYLSKIESAQPVCNYAYLAPHGNLRMQVIGLDNRKATVEEIKQMKELLREALDQGACGLSSGLIYLPCMYGDYTEIEALCEVAAEYGVPFIVHQRSEGDEILESMDELLVIAERTGVHLHFSHFKVCGRLNWHKTREVLVKLDNARHRGIEVTFDQYPYTAGSTMLSATLPPWAHEGGAAKLMERLRTPELREKMAADMTTGFAGWDSMYAWAGPDGILITSVETEQNKNCVGRTLQQITEARGSSDPISTALDLILEENNAVGMVDFVMDDASVATIMQHPAGTICTDGLLGGQPHPRAFGSFPKVLGKYTREDKLFTLEESIRRMTSQPARIIGFTDRGTIRKGMKADIVIFDEAGVKDTATYDNPRSYSEGIALVMVNGKLVVEGDAEHRLPSGKVLRRSYL